MSNRLSITIVESVEHFTEDFNPDGTLKPRETPRDPDASQWLDVVVKDDYERHAVWLGNSPYPQGAEALFRYAISNCDVRYLVQQVADNKDGIIVDGSWRDFDEWKGWLE